MNAMNLKNKLRLSLIGIAIIPIIFLGVIIHKQSKENIRSKISVFASKTVAETANHLANRFDNIEGSLGELITSDYIQSNLHNYENIPGKEMSEISKSINDIMFRDYIMGDSMEYCDIFTMEDDVFYNYGYIIADKSYYPQVKDKALELGGLSYYDANVKEELIVIGRAINKRFTLKPMGYMIMSLKEGYFSEVYEGLTQINTEIKVMILDSKGVVFSSNVSGIKGSYYTDLSDGKAFIYGHDESGYEDVIIQGKPYVNAYSKVENTDFYLLCLIPYTYLNEETNELGSIVIMTVVGCVILAVIVAFMLTKGIVWPLNKLVDTMKQAKTGELSIQMDYDKKDEIGYLTTNFNDMMQQIHQLIIKLEEEERLKREAELNMLQAQINPHFLFNVLNSLKFTAMMSQSYSVVEGINALANLLRDTINNRNEFVTLEHELENIKHYITIQQLRYGESFDMNVCMDPSVLQCRIPKLLLQPIVENCIIHGFEDIEYPGVITVTGNLSDGVVTLTIQDNGRGLSKEKLKDIQTSEYHSRKQLSSIGLHNVKQRIKLHFGQEHEVFIDSDKEGTKVTMTIPYQA